MFFKIFIMLYPIILLYNIKILLTKQNKIPNFKNINIIITFVYGSLAIINSSSVLNNSVTLNLSYYTSFYN